MSEIIEESTIEDTRPDWLPSNFRSPEDFAKSYSEAQATLTRQSQELAAVKAQQEEFIAQQQVAEQSQQRHSTQDALVDAWESGDTQQQLAAIAWLIQQGQTPAQAQTQHVDTEVLAFTAEQKLVQKYGDYGDYVDDIRGILSDDPSLLGREGDTPSLPTVVKGLEKAYKLAKADRVLSSSQEFVQSEQEQNRLVKQQAQTITGASQRPAVSDPANDYWESVKAVSPGGYTPVGRL